MLKLFHKGHAIKQNVGLDIPILQVAEHFHMSPDAVENMSLYWFNRTMIYLKAKAEANNEQ